MTNFTELLLLSKVFTKTILENNDPSRKCFTTAYPLSLHLENNGFSNLITKGFFNQTPHYWLTVNQQRDIIIDPTRKQFYKEEDIVYIGKKSDEYIFFSDEETQPNLIEDVYEDWIKLFINPDDFSKIEQEVFLEINTKAAIFIHNELIERKIDINNSQKHLIYFKGISEMFKNSFDKIKKFECLEGFECLELKYKNGYI